MQRWRILSRMGSFTGSRSGFHTGFRTSLRYWAIALVSCLVLVNFSPVLASLPPEGIESASRPWATHRVAQLSEQPLPKQPLPEQSEPRETSVTQSGQALDGLALGKQLYDAGRLREAAQTWQQAAGQFARQNQPTAQATALRYLAIAQQDLGQLAAAESTITQALVLAQPFDSPLLQAQILNTQGSIQLNQGRTEVAYATYIQAEERYQHLKDRRGIALSQINQIQVLQVLGFYRRAEQQLLSLQQFLGLPAEASTDQRAVLGSDPHSSKPPRDLQLQAEILLSLAQVWEGIGNLSEADTALEQSSAIFKQLGAQNQLAAAQLLQGDVARDQQRLPEAIAHYRSAEAIAPNLSTKTEAQLRQLRLLVQTKDFAAARPFAQQLLRQLTPLPLNRWEIEARVNLAESLQLMTDLDPILGLLAPALEQAQTLGDRRSESYVLGQQGHVLEAQKRWPEALAVTRQARQRAAEIGADEITIHWLWQEGRILKSQGDNAAAISTYSEAVNLLQSLRQDLVAINPEAQFSFRDEVEPVYRQLVELLLQNVDALPANLKQQQLEQARQTLEALQLAQVQNFLREACETYDVQPIEQIDPQAAVFYPIVLGDRLEVILALPGLPLQHYGSQLSSAEQQQHFTQLRQSLNPAFPPSDGLAAAQQFYDQLIRPGETWLSQQKIQTLVFVLDDFLRDVPMAVLHDGDRYLVEKYSLALTPGLQLFDAKSLADERLQVLAGGLSQARQGFSALPGVEQELQSISQRPPAKLRAKVLLDQAFTANQLIRQVKAQSFNVLHLATHGQFSSKAKDTFLLTWNDRLGINELDQSLNPIADGEPRTPIEMLILSACQTAKGDRRATLGLAGLAVGSGARSTLATLWSVQDDSTAQLIETFYGQLIQEEAGRAEALRQAQLALISSSEYSHPYYWAPFVLVGNWQ